MSLGYGRLRGWWVPVMAATLLVAALCGLESTFAYTLPLLLVLLPLLAGRYPGEEKLARSSAAARQFELRPRSAAVPEAWSREHRPALCGGRLIALALAMRPPPRPIVL